MESENKIKLMHKETAAGMFYEWKDCSCCQIPTIFKVGEYETVRYGKRDEYFIHIPSASLRMGEVEIDGKVYIIFSVNNSLFAIYNRYSQGLGWLTSIYEIVKA